MAIQDTGSTLAPSTPWAAVRHPRVLALLPPGEPLGEALSVKPGAWAVGGMLVVHEEMVHEEKTT